RAESAFRRERAHDAALRDIGQEAQRAIEARLSAAVRTGDDVQRPQGEHDIAQRAVSGNGELGEHELSQKSTLRRRFIVAYGQSPHYRLSERGACLLEYYGSQNDFGTSISHL